MKKIVFLLALSALITARSSVYAQSGAEAEFLKSYEKSVGVRQGESLENLRTDFLARQNATPKTYFSGARLEMQPLRLPGFRDLAYTTYNVFPQNMASAASWSGLTTLQLPVSGNVWVTNDPKYNTPGYMFIRGLLQPGGLGTAIIQQGLGGTGIFPGLRTW